MEIVSKVFAAATVIGNDMIAVLDHAKKIVHFKAIAIMELACATKVSNIFYYKDLLDNYANLNVVQTDVQVRKTYFFYLFNKQNTFRMRYDNINRKWCMLT
jgi:hypothetical protein